MGYEGLYEEYGFPMKGSKLDKLKKFLLSEGLSYDEGVEFTISLCDRKGEIVATGSLEGNILKCIAVSNVYQGEGLSAKIVTALVSRATTSGHSHLFLFTKPLNKNKFGDLGFYLIAETNDVVLMENYKNGISQFIEGLKPKENRFEDIGAMVLNCNPFTKGHLYLIETAARQCDFLNLFIVSENKSIFPADVRFELVKKGVAHLENVVVYPTSDYLISSVTFPTYFIKEKQQAENINCILDLTLFCDHFAKKLGITKRLVGTEPYDKVTNAYNFQMKQFLKVRGIEVIEIPRLKEKGSVISASRVRKLLAAGNYEEIKGLVPQVTYDFLLSGKGKEIAERLIKGLR